MVTDAAVGIPDAVKRQAEQDEAAQQVERETIEKVQPVEKKPPETAEATPPQPPAPPVESPGTVTALRRALGEKEAALAKAEKRYVSLKGMMKQMTTSDNSAEIKALRAEIDELKQRPAAPYTPQPPAYTTYLTDAEREVHDPTNASADVRIARGETEEKLAVERRAREELQARVERMEAEKNQSEQDGAATIMWMDIEDIFPGAQTLNNHQVFVDWIDLPDPRNGRGESYKVRAEDCFGRGDARGVAEIMQECIDVHPEIMADIKVSAMERPTQSHAVETPVQTGEIQVTEGEAARFLNDRQRGECKEEDGSPMSEERMDQIEATIDNAMRRGELIPGN
jgi:hypothetical protein